MDLPFAMRCLCTAFLITAFASVVTADEPTLLDSSSIASADYVLAAAEEAEAEPATAEPEAVFQHSHDWVHADDHHSARRKKADKHAPAGLMGDHVHNQGEWMVEYKYMIMYMDDNKVGDNRISDVASMGVPAPPAPPGFDVDGIRTNAGATPTQMTMEMHMVHLMYGLTDDITIYTMLNFPVLTMDHIRGFGNMAGGGPGSGFTTHTSGLGDTVFGALASLTDDEDDDIILNLGFSVPTADIFTTSANPTAGAVELPLPFPMRKGSGTFNARPGITWKHYEDCGSWGAQFQTDIPIGRNYRNYSVSDIYQLNFWYSHLITDNLAFSVRLENLWKSNYDGEDPNTPDILISTNVEEFRGGYTLNLGLGVATLLDGHLLNVELVPTLYQDLNGVQLETDWSLIASWSRSF